MDRCPVELWMKIVALSCTDGGHTGRSLSLVSRTMHDIAEPIRFHSVSLIGEQRLLAFAQLLDQRSSAPVIRHLLVSATIPQHELHVGALSKADELWLALYHILRMAAPHVWTIAVHQIECDIVSSTLAFPVLRDLVVDKTGPDPGLEASRFPSLRRLHVTAYTDTGSFWTSMGRFALTHLRISGITQDIAISPFLRVLLDIPVEKWPDNIIVVGADSEYGAMSTYTSPSTDATEEEVAAAGLAALQHIVVQPFDYKSNEWGDTGYVRHNLMKTGLRRIAEGRAQGLGNGKQLHLLPDSSSYGLEEACRDWVDLAEGGDGPWSSSSKSS